MEKMRLLNNPIPEYVQTTDSSQSTAKSQQPDIPLEKKGKKRKRRVLDLILLDGSISQFC
jgi:hypothetical protein